MRPRVLIDRPAIEIIWWPYREWRWRTVTSLAGTYQIIVLWFEIRLFSREFQKRYAAEQARQKW